MDCSSRIGCSVTCARISEIGMHFEMSAPPLQKTTPSGHAPALSVRRSSYRSRFQSGLTDATYLLNVSESPITVSCRRGRVIDTAKTPFISCRSTADTRTETPSRTKLRCTYHLVFVSLQGTLFHRRCVPDSPPPPLSHVPGSHRRFQARFLGMFP